MVSNNGSPAERRTQPNTMGKILLTIHVQLLKWLHGKQQLPTGDLVSSSVSERSDPSSDPVPRLRLRFSDILLKLKIHSLSKILIFNCLVSIGYYIW